MTRSLRVTTLGPNQRELLVAELAERCRIAIDAARSVKTTGAVTETHLLMNCLDAMLTGIPFIIEELNRLPSPSPRERPGSVEDEAEAILKQEGAI